MLCSMDHHVAEGSYKELSIGKDGKRSEFFLACIFFKNLVILPLLLST